MRTPRLVQWFVAVVAPVTLAHASVPTEDVGDDARADFDAIAVPYWTAAERRMGELSGRYVNHRTWFAAAHLPPGSISDTTQAVAFDFSSGTSSAKYSTTNLADPTDVSILGMNADHKFSLSKRGDQRNYRVTDFTRFRTGESFFLGRVTNDPNLRRAFAAESLDTIRLPGLAANASGRFLKSVRYARRPEGQRVELECEIPWAVPGNPPMQIKAVLNPALHWAVEQWEGHRAGQGVTRGRTTFQVVDGGLPFPATYAFESIDRDGEPIVRETYTFDPPTFHQGSPVPAEQFTLAAFGLPEPGKVATGSRVGLWGTVGLVAAGIVLAVLARWRKAPPARTGAA